MTNEHIKPSYQPINVSVSNDIVIIMFPEFTAEQMS